MLYLYNVNRNMCSSTVLNYNEVRCGVLTTYFLYFGKQYVVMFAFRFCLRSDEVHSAPCVMELDYPVKIVEVP